MKRKLFKKLNKKVDGYANVIALVCMTVVSICVSIFTMQMGKVYTSKCYSQTTADAIANAIASYSSIGTSFDATKAEEMFHKMQELYPTYTISMDASKVSANHIIVTAEHRLSYPWIDTEATSSFWSPFFATPVNTVKSDADVELVPQAQLAKIKGAFPQDPKMTISPFVTGSPSNVMANNYVLLDAIVSQFYTEGRNRYRYSGEKDTVYGSMDAYHLLIGDVLTAMGFSPNMNGFTAAGSTNGKGSNKPLTDGYVYVGTYKGHDYIVFNPEEKDTVKILYLDESKEDGMSKMNVPINEISNLRKSPSKWYTPTNEEEINKKENTIKYF